MPRFLYRIGRPVLAYLWVVLRGLTLGVRAAVFDAEGRVLLIRHRHIPGWQLPGGGVEIGETALEALARELREEANITLTGPPVLRGIFHLPFFSPRDHTLVYEVRAFTWAGAPKPNQEIAECAFFALDALPENINPGAQRRLREILDQTPATPVW